MYNFYTKSINHYQKLFKESGHYCNKNKKMKYSFTIQSELPISLEVLAEQLFNMTAVNAELAPLISMTAPDWWQARRFEQWPEKRPLFTSTLLLFGFIPIDKHRFYFEETSTTHFVENSTSIMNKIWQHERRLQATTTGCLIIDRVTYQSQLGSNMGWFFKPIYQVVFARRHRYLRQHYQ